MANQAQTNPNGSLRLTPDICTGRSGDMLLQVLRQIAPERVRLVGLDLETNVKECELKLFIYWRYKDVDPRYDTRVSSDRVLIFTVDYWNPELPAEVILAKLALI